MNYRTRKLSKEIGIIFLIAAVLTVLPRLLVTPLMGTINLIVTVATIWILYRILSPILRPIYRDYRRRYRSRRSRPQNWYSDRR